MPSVLDCVRINANGRNEKLDRRIKLTERDKETIRSLYFDSCEATRPTMTQLACNYEVDRRLIQFVLFPEREARQKELAKQRRKDGRYYDRERSNINNQNHRNYKRELIRQGKL